MTGALGPLRTIAADPDLRIIGYRDLAKLAVAIEYELTRRTIAHTPTEEAATLIPA